MTGRRSPWLILTANTLAFTVCFASWTLNGVLVTYLVERGIMQWSLAEAGWLIGIPVLTGSLFRLPAGMLTDRYGGRIVFTALLLISAVPMYLLGEAQGYWDYLLASAGFGLAGASFSVGIAYTSIVFSRERQGFALGIFGAGNAGAAVTSIAAPALLLWIGAGSDASDAWRVLPRFYAAALVVTALIFVAITEHRVVDHARSLTLRQRLAPLGSVRVWRFGLYYFVVFGGFVALAQWLIPYYVSAYAMSLAAAGLMASIFSFPSGVIRALGGWLSDRFGGRAVMYWVFGGSLVCYVLLCVPRMEIDSPGEGVLAARAGVVTAVSPEAIHVDDHVYPLQHDPHPAADVDDAHVLVLPRFSFAQEPLVEVGDHVTRRQLLARGTTHIFFQANVWIFTALVFIVGILMGIGKAGVYKFIPDYYPDAVGAVGGIVGVIGGLGGFICPILFGWLLGATGIWTTAWMFLFVVTLVCHLWMHSTVRKLMRRGAPALADRIDARDGETGEDHSARLAYSTRNGGHHSEVKKHGGLPS